MLKSVIFDLDGTLLNTENAILASLSTTLQEFQVPVPDLHFALGIPGQETLRRLGLEGNSAVLERWIALLKKHRHALYSGIETCIRSLKDDGYVLGIITSKTRAEYIS